MQNQSKIALDASETIKTLRVNIEIQKIPLEEHRKFGCWNASKIRAILGYRYAASLFFEEETEVK